MIQGYQEQIFLFYILSNKILLAATKPEFFTNKVLSELFSIAKEHTLKYNDPPTKEQMIELVKIKGMGEEFNEDIINALFNTRLQLEQYDKKWLEENVEPWIQVRNLDFVMRKAIAFMKTTEINAENASEVVEKIRHMLSSETAIDFSFDLGSDFFDPASHLQTRLARTSTGYDYLDICLDGGYWKGSLIVFLGGPKAGKSTWLANLAARSIEMGCNTAYITLELQKEIINMRIGSNLLNILLSEYKEISKDQDLLRKKLNDYKNQASQFKKIGALHVQEFPSSTASTNDIRFYLKKTEELLGIKFDNVFIDYINIMKNWRNPNTENTYMKIKQISEDLRAMGMEENWAVISVTQTNRGGWETNDLNIVDIAESAALLHTVDGLFGIITNAEMKARGEYYLKYLADRVSGYENTRKRFEVDWKYCRIEEDKNSQIEDMDFILNYVISGGKRNKRGSVPRGNPSHIAIVARDKIEEDKKEISSNLNSDPNKMNITGEGLF